MYNLMSYIGAPLEIVKNLENTEVPETYSGEFECVLSREDAEGTWYFENKAITPSLKYVVSARRGRHSLSVKDVKKEDQGKYTFKVGDLKTSASLKMKGENEKTRIKIFRSVFYKLCPFLLKLILIICYN